METYRGIALGQWSTEKENFCFSLQTGQIFIRHSEYAIHKVVRDLNLSYAIINRDKYYWTVRQQNLTQCATYTPRY